MYNNNPNLYIDCLSSDNLISKLSKYKWFLQYITTMDPLCYEMATHHKVSGLTFILNSLSEGEERGEGRWGAGGAARESRSLTHSSSAISQHVSKVIS